MQVASCLFVFVAIALSTVEAAPAAGDDPKTVALLDEAEALDAEVEQLYADGKYEISMPKVRRSLAIR